MGNQPTTCYQALGEAILGPSPFAPCDFYVFSDAQPGTVADKTNKLMNYIIGPTTTQELIDYVSGDASNALCSYTPFNEQCRPYPNWALAWPLIFPPVIENVYVINNANTPTKGYPAYSSTPQQLNPEFYTIIPNPWVEAARTMEALLFGTSGLGAFPCQKSYSLPYAVGVYQSSGGFFGGFYTTFETITNPNFDTCFANMVQKLQVRSSSTQQCNPPCIGGSSNSTYLDGPLGFDLSKVQSLMDADAKNATTDPRSTVLYKFLTDSTSDNAEALFFTQFQIGPYDTSTQAPCTDLTSPTCTYQICQGINARGYNCTTNGCCPIYDPALPPPLFSTQEQCENCYQSGNCGPNKCCPDSVKVNGVCPTPGPNPSPGSGGGIGASVWIWVAIFVIALVALVYFFA